MRSLRLHNAHILASVASIGYRRRGQYGDTHLLVLNQYAMFLRKVVISYRVITPPRFCNLAGFCECASSHWTTEVQQKGVPIAGFSYCNKHFSFSLEKAANEVEVVCRNISLTDEQRQACMNRYCDKWKGRTRWVEEGYGCLFSLGSITLAEIACIIMHKIYATMGESIYPSLSSLSRNFPEASGRLLRIE